jgi:6-pyruvoyltetrahydropterin/6-carboxytetrahydropterin synthase
VYQLKTEREFDGAHFLTDYQGKCENLHGHRWRVVVYIRQESLGTAGTEKDMVIDFGRFKRTVREEVDRFDHMFLVEEGSLMPKTLECLREEGFTLMMLPFRTTSENLARYFADRLIARGLPVSQVDVYETPMNCATYLVPATAEVPSATTEEAAR